MQIIENKILKEKVYTEKLETGLTIMCIPKENTRKKYVLPPQNPYLCTFRAVFSFSP